MKHFVAYHSVTQMGRELEFAEGTFTFRSSKSCSKEAIGNKVWIIVGTPVKRRKTRFCLRGYFIPLAVTQLEQQEDGNGFKYVLFGTEGYIFSSPVELNNLAWFGDFKKEQGNFGFGINLIKDNTAVQSLILLSEQANG